MFWVLEGCVGVVGYDWYPGGLFVLYLVVVSGSWFALRLVLWLCGSQVTLAMLVFWLELLVYGALL